jgi:hypothetical protein
MERCRNSCQGDWQGPGALSTGHAEPQGQASCQGRDQLDQGICSRKQSTLWATLHRLQAPFLECCEHQLYDDWPGCWTLCTGDGPT